MDSSPEESWSSKKNSLSFEHVAFNSADYLPEWLGWCWLAIEIIFLLLRFDESTIDDFWLYRASAALTASWRISI